MPLLLAELAALDGNRVGLRPLWSSGLSFTFLPEKLKRVYPGKQSCAVLMNRETGYKLEKDAVLVEE